MQQFDDIINGHTELQESSGRLKEIAELKDKEPVGLPLLALVAFLSMTKNAHEIHHGNGLDVRLSLAVALSTIPVTGRFSSVPPQFRGRTPWGWGQGPPTHLTRGLAARRLFRIPPCCKGTINLQTSISSPGFEPRPYGTAVSVANHYIGWATSKNTKLPNA
ncbi:hypothetical protein TNCV_3234501 [Trichonephila clavipes]|nr:hypothetical protein TNCV_3234501 [Trichonephila clavipes]